MEKVDEQLYVLIETAMFDAISEFQTACTADGTSCNQ